MINYKRFVKGAFAYLNKKNRVVIGSTGRSGSTMLFDSVAKSFLRQRFHVDEDSPIGEIIMRLMMGFVDRLSEVDHFSPLMIKTHDVYSLRYNIRNVKYIYIYGDPLDSALSVFNVVKKEGKEWFDLHKFHLKGEGEFSDLFQKDVLNYENQIKSWLATQESNVLCVAYEDLWENAQVISEFLGFELILPEKRKRSDKDLKLDINKDMFERLEKIMKEYSVRYKKI